jgi:hypothetical protein
VGISLSGRRQVPDDNDEPVERPRIGIPLRVDGTRRQILLEAVCEHLEARFPGRLASWEKKEIATAVLAGHEPRPDDDTDSYLSTLWTAADKEALEHIQGKRLRDLFDGPGALDRADREFVRSLFGDSVNVSCVHAAVRAMYAIAVVDRSRETYFLVVAQYLDMAYLGGAAPSADEVAATLRSGGRQVTTRQAEDALRELAELLEKLANL